MFATNILKTQTFTNVHEIRKNRKCHKNRRQVFGVAKLMREMLEKPANEYVEAKYSMAERLANLGADITFTTLAGVGHWGWGNIYSNPQNIDWLLGHNKRDRIPSTVSDPKSWGQIKAESKQD